MCFAAGRTNLDLNNSLAAEDEATLIVQHDLGILKLEHAEVRQLRHEQEAEESKRLDEFWETPRFKARRVAMQKKLREHQNQRFRAGQAQ